MEFPSCTALKLTSREGRPYWFRTCDIGNSIWEQGAHIVSFPRGGVMPLVGRPDHICAHALVGMSYTTSDTWLMDAVNDAGLAGGLLALYEATSLSACEEDEGVVGMEIVSYLLSTCGSMEEIREAARRVRILDVPIPEGRSAATMHCMFLDETGSCLILEAADPSRPGQFTLYEKNLGLMTNSPPYPGQLDNLRWFLAHSPELNWDRTEPAQLTLNGMTVVADPDAPHFTASGTFPASYASCDRFIRQAVLTAYNHEGRDFPDERMLSLGSELMAPVIEPRNQGVFHYIRFDAQDGPQSGHESYTQYLVMYDPTRRRLYMRPYGATAWTMVALDRCDTAARQRHELCWRCDGGVVEK